MAAALLVLFRPDWLPADIAVAATVPMLAAAAAWIIHYAKIERAPVPLLPVTATFYAVCYGLSVFLGGFSHSKWPEPFRYYDLDVSHPMDLLDLKVQMLAGVAACLFVGAALLASRVAIRPYRVPALRRPFLHGALWSLVAIHFLWLMNSRLHGLASVGQFLAPAGLFALGGLYVEFRREQVSRVLIAVLGLLILAELGIRGATATVTQPVLAILFAFLLLTRINGRMPLRTMVFGLAVVVVAYPAIFEIRERVADVMKSGGQPSLVTVGQGIAEHYSGAAAVQLANDSVATLSQRVGLIYLLNHVARTTPEPVPYWGGATYLPLATALVPRIFWAGKPEERLGWEFRQRYRLLHHDTNPTIVNVPWLVEMFANFGSLGVLIGMPLAGLLFGLFDRVFNRREVDHLSACAGLVVVFPLVYQESNLSLMVGSLPQLAVALWGWIGVAKVMEGLFSSSGPMTSKQP